MGDDSADGAGAGQRTSTTGIRKWGYNHDPVNEATGDHTLKIEVRPFVVRHMALPFGITSRKSSFDSRLTGEGIVVIKAQQHRTQERNRADAVERLRALVAAAAARPKPRRPTRPPRASKRRRLEGKRHRSQVKALRARVLD